MAKRKFALTPEQDNELKAAYSQCRNSLTKIRYQAVRLYGTGYRVEEIENITGCSRPSLMEWCRAYRQLGVAGLVDKRRGGNRAFLTPSELEQVQQQLESYTPHQLLGAECYGDGQFWTVPDLAKLVKHDYGITYKSASSYRLVFDRCDFSCQRPGSHYEGRTSQDWLRFGRKKT